jgi:hypothetical protein
MRWCRRANRDAASYHQGVIVVGKELTWAVN